MGKQNQQLSQTTVSGSDIQNTADLVLSYLKDRKCTAIPTRVLFKVVEKIENKNISFTFKNESKSKWTVIHALYCHCH
jgi:hypothetical protein